MLPLAFLRSRSQVVTNFIAASVSTLHGLTRFSNRVVGETGIARVRPVRCHPNPDTPRRGGRVADCTGLENRQGRKFLVGSNPTLSAGTVEKSPGFSAVSSFSSESSFCCGCAPERTEARLRAGRFGKRTGKTSTAVVPVARIVSCSTGFGPVEGSGGSFATAAYRSNRPA